MTTKLSERQTEAADPTESRWGLEHGDEIVSGLSAIKLLGGGFRYEAYLAWSDRLRSLVVTKVVRPGLVADRRTLEGLADEVAFLERLRHPVLLRSFGHRLDAERPHLVLEHLEGPRLSSLLRRYGPLAPEQLLPLALQLCSAVHYLGEEGVAHLDVKPSNIIMGAPARLIDMSVARTVEECRGLRSPVGTDSYMAPEQCRPDGPVPVGPPADVWGIGVTLFRAAGGERPFSRGEHASELSERRWPQLAEEPIDLRDRFPGELGEAVMSCLHPVPGRRPTPAALADRLEPLLDELPGPRLSRLKPRVRI